MAHYTHRSHRLSFSRIQAILIKELIQMKRDRLTFAMLLMIPIMQLILFGFVINNHPKHLPTAIYLQENTEITRSIISNMAQSDYFDVVADVNTLNAYRGTAPLQDTSSLLQSGKVNFVLTIPLGFSKAWVRGEKPSLLLEADATDPAAAAMAVAQISPIVERTLADIQTGSLNYLKSKPSSINVVVHNKYNPEGISQFNIVPGLLGVILTMTMVMITSIAMTREAERGTMENLLAMPSKPLEVMIGKITPYVLMGLVQTIIILLASDMLFHVPFVGSGSSFALGVGLFILTNLAIGFTFSTIAKSQMQAMQLTFFFFLPSMLLSGFMFPFQGMPRWAQYIGEILPLTHFLRIVRGIMLKGTTLNLLANEFFALVAILIIVGTVAMLRYRQTLD
ncbi:ABC transporter permease [Moraxella osloensis]|uniref:ABC transporter permease n=1 Tax=Moraxella sp. CTOTU49803 TaxID=2953840 RepID=UPI0024C4217E|nr:MULTISPECIES: ABC transporter permease [Moraxella]MDK1670933.1 ABC transporter permease [Moraxella osloensis]